MMHANWNYPTAVRVGAGRVNELPALCLDKGIKRPLLVTDKGLAEMPMVSEIQALCERAGLGLAVFSEVKSNPTGMNIKEGVESYRSGHHDGVIALGGGSALDVGKSIAVIAQQDCTLWDLEDEGENWKRADASKIVPIIALPTTAGTGSEVGRAAVIVHEQQQRKVIIFHPNMMPESVILDPELTCGLPAKLTAATGMDALSHNLEAYCSPFYHPMAQGISIEGISLIKGNLSAAVVDGFNIEARTQMLVASAMGATAFQRGLGAMHALAHPLGAIYDAHHGMLNAVLMPYVLMANYSAINETVARLASYLELDADFDAFMQWVLDLRHSIGIPHALDALIPHDLRVTEIGEMAVLDASSLTNPVQHNSEAYATITRNALNGVL